MAELKIVVKRLGNLKLRIRIQPDTNQFAESGSEIITQLFCKKFGFRIRIRVSKILEPHPYPDQNYANLDPQHCKNHKTLEQFCYVKGSERINYVLKI